MNLNTDRAGFLAQLREGNQNFAVAMHIRKVEVMSDAQFEAHLAKLRADRLDPVRNAAISRMAATVSRKYRKI